MRLWIWNHIHINTPPDWEMLLFARQASRGRCTFADRDGYRMQVIWRPMDGEPDISRMISDYQGEMEGDATVRQITPLRHGAWRGLAYRKDNSPFSRHVRYFPKSSGLLEVVFPPGDSTIPAPVESVLQNMDWIPVDAAAEPLARWKAFGMDWLAPSAMELESCEVHPGAVRVRFTPPGAGEDGPRESFRRLGMVRHWLAGTVAAWLRGQTHPDWKMERDGSTDHAGHRIEWLEGRVPPKKRLRLLRSRALRFRSAAWTCPVDERVYHHESVFEDGREPGAPVADGSRPGHRLRCCHALGGGDV